MKLFSLTLFFLLFLFSCSTEKNTLINRSYNGMTAHYNGYFNANELINTSMNSFKSSKKEDYYNLLPIELLPEKTDVEGMLPSLDTAISKCKKVISNHSMPSFKDIGAKKEEHNRWVDENWITIGISNYYKLDYDMALKNFSYINKFFSNDPSNYLAAVWMAKTNIKINKLSDAKIIITKLDKDLEQLEELKNEKKNAKKDKKSSSKKSKKKNGKEEKPKAEFPKKTKYLLELTRAELLLLEDETPKAIEALEKALVLCKKGTEKARINFILGQLNAAGSDSEKAYKHFTKVLKYNAPFEMNFSARINRAILGGDAKLKKQLEKMLRDEKNAEFKDQIYYALAEIAFKENENDKGKSYLIKSIFYSVSNNRQKAMCYERLGDFSYQERNYISAQKYYDSCVTVLTDTYPNADVIRNKAIKLKDLVIAVETAHYEDSVLRIAAMSPDDREAFAKKLVKKIKEDEEKRKLLEEAKLKELQKVQMANAEAKATTKFFWNHAKTKEEGLESFRKQWGQRQNEDDWRRNDKIVFANFIDPENDTLPIQVVEEVKEDSLSPELLLSKLPLTDSSKTASYERLFTALFDAGVIYNDQLKEEKMAVQQFTRILDKNVPSKYVLLALFQLYKMNEVANPTEAYNYKTRILNEYPYSDYAKYLNDPDFFVKQKQFEKLNEEDFVKMLDRYNRGLYPIVISGSEDIIENHPENLYRSKYMLLNVLAVGQTNTNKRVMIPLLNRIIKEYPDSDEDKRAKELLNMIENGYSKFQETDFNKTFVFKYEEAADHLVVIFTPKNQNSSLAKAKISDFNKEYYQKEQLNVSSKIFNENQSVIVIKTFNEFTGKEYINELKTTKKDLMNLEKEKILLISTENLKILFETFNLEEYDLFFTEFY